MLGECSKLNARQKKALFKDTFGAILFPAGFIYKDNYFIRVHPHECVYLNKYAKTKVYVTLAKTYAQRCIEEAQRNPDFLLGRSD